jgi:hypothetical protein
MAEELAGLDHVDAGDAVAYVRELLEGADAELVARMLEPHEPGPTRNAVARGRVGDSGGRP